MSGLSVSWLTRRFANLLVLENTQQVPGNNGAEAMADQAGLSTGWSKVGMDIVKLFE